MKELTVDQIAAALAGHPGGQWPELRLLMLFLSDPDDRGEVEPESFRDALPRAA